MKTKKETQIENVKFSNYKLTQHMFDDFWFVIPKNQTDGYITNSKGIPLTNATYWRYEGITDGDYELILMSSNNEGKGALLNKEDFSVVIPPYYDSICCFWEGLAEVKLNDKYGFIDINQNIIIPIIYDYADGFLNGKAKVKLNDETFYINKNGEKIKNNSDKI